MLDLVYVMSHLADETGKILIPGIMNDVAKVTEKERQLYKDIDFDLVSTVTQHTSCNRVIQLETY